MEKEKIKLDEKRVTVTSDFLYFFQTLTDIFGSDPVLEIARWMLMEDEEEKENIKQMLLIFIQSTKETKINFEKAGLMAGGNPDRTIKEMQLERFEFRKDWEKVLQNRAMDLAKKDYQRITKVEKK